MKHRNTISRCMATLLLLALLSLQAKSQSCTLKGFIYESATGNPLEFVNITLDGHHPGTYSDQQGYYILEGLLPGEYQLKVFRLGYDTTRKTVTLSDNEIRVLNFVLEKKSYPLKEVQVISEDRSKRKEVGISRLSIIPADIERTPSLGGLPDLVQHIRTLPGVVARGDVGGQLYIRGGTPVQNKVIMDEVVVYSPIHSIGLYSVFDDDYIQGAEVYTGGYDARFGGAISSVINVKTKMGNQHRYSGRADLSTIGSRLMVEGPLLRKDSTNKTALSFILSVKNSHFRQAKEMFYGYVDHELPFYFNDIYGKLTTQAGDNFKMNIFAYSFRDHTSYNGSSQDFSKISRGIGGNFLVMPHTASVLMKVYFATSDFKMNLEEPLKDTRYSKIASFTIGFKLYKYLKRQTIRYGFEILGMKTDYRYTTSDFNEFSQLENSTEVSTFLQYQAKPGKFILEPGIRVTYYATLSKLAPEPRFLAKYLVSDRFRLKISAGMYSQNLISAVSDRDIVNYFEGYISAPVVVATRPGEDPNNFFLQTASHYIAGFEFDLGRKISANVEVYYKDYTNLLNFNKKKIFTNTVMDPESTYFMADFIPESGYAAGCDMSLNYSDQRTKINLAYSLATTEREYRDADDAVITYYPQFDRRHNLNITASVILGRRGTWEINARWNWGSGFPYTPAIGYYEGISFDENAQNNYLSQNGDMSILYGTYNSKRLPDYHRFDIGAKKTMHIGKHSSLVAEATIINLYNRKNIFYIDRRTNATVYQLPFLPGFRVGYSF